MQHYYEAVKGLGNVALSRHAQEKIRMDNISIKDFERALLNPTREVQEGHGIVWREHAGVRVIVIRKPEPFHGACLVTTVFRVQRQERII